MFGGREQDIRRILPLAASAVLWGIAGSGLETQGKTHIFDRGLQVAMNVNQANAIGAWLSKLGKVARNELV